MARIFITGSTDGLGRATAQQLLDGGHQVIVHARSLDRLSAVRDLIDRGAVGVVGDLSDIGETRDVGAQVNRIGHVDAVIHNAGVLGGPHIFQVNVVAPYLLTVLIQRPERLIYLSSGMHRGGHPGLTGTTPKVSYSDSKLFVTALAAAVARLCPDVLSNAVDPGWVPTKMGGPGAPDDLRLGHLTQEWLATSDDPEARTSGGYWHHQRRHKAHPQSTTSTFRRLSWTTWRASPASASPDGGPAPPGRKPVAPTLNERSPRAKISYKLSCANNHLEILIYNFVIAI